MKLSKLIPDSMKACSTGWVEKDLSKTRFNIIPSHEYTNKYHRDGLEESYRHISKSLPRQLRNEGKDVSMSNTIEFLVSEEVFVKIARYTSQVLVKRRLEPVNCYELRQFFAHKLLRSRFDVSTEKAWSDFMEPLAVKHGFTLMPVARFNNILTSVRGYDVNSRAGDSGDSSWKQRKNLLRSLEEIEKAMFNRSASFLFNTKNGVLVVDDELVGSRASDVESKAHSQRKTGVDGPVSDAMADSMICLLLGMRLRVTGTSHSLYSLIFANLVLIDCIFDFSHKRRIAAR